MIVRYSPRTDDSAVAVKGCLSILFFIMVFAVSSVFFVTFSINRRAGASGVFIWLAPLSFAALVSRWTNALLGRIARILSGSARKTEIGISGDGLDAGSRRIEFRKILRFQFSHRIDQGSGILYAVHISGEKIPVTTEVTQSQGQEILRIILQRANASGYSIES